MGDGFWNLEGSNGGYYSPYDRAVRQDAWWALASGSRGILSESVYVSSWNTFSAPGDVTGIWQWVFNLPYIVSSFSSWTGWHKLLPDLSSTFVTGGRGTRVAPYVSGGSGGTYESTFTNSWVAASITSDGTLAVCYLPNSTTITVNTSMLANGWTATWVDPINAATK